MTESEHSFDTKVLIAVLSLLSVVAVVLVVANILVPILNGRRYDFSDDNLAKECLEMKDDLSAESCIEEKVYSYYDEGDCENALKVYDDIPDSWFEEDYMGYIYDDAYSISLSCEDESSQAYWENKNNKFSNQTEARN